MPRSPCGATRKREEEGLAGPPWGWGLSFGPYPSHPGGRLGGHCLERGLCSLVGQDQGAVAVAAWSQAGRKARAGLSTRAARLGQRHSLTPERQLKHENPTAAGQSEACGVRGLRWEDGGRGPPGARIRSRGDHRMGCRSLEQLGRRFGCGPGPSHTGYVRRDGDDGLGCCRPRRADRLAGTRTAIAIAEKPIASFFARAFCVSVGCPCLDRSTGTHLHPHIHTPSPSEHTLNHQNTARRVVIMGRPEQQGFLRPTASSRAAAAASTSSSGGGGFTHPTTGRCVLRPCACLLLCPWLGWSINWLIGRID